MCIANPSELGFFAKLYCTHPKVDDRLTALMNMMGKENSQNKAPLGRVIG